MIDIIIEPGELIQETQSLGIENVIWDGEGLLGNSQNKNVFFQKEYMRDIGVYEMIGTKR